MINEIAQLDKAVNITRISSHAQFLKKVCIFDLDEGEKGHTVNNGSFECTGITSQRNGEREHFVSNINHSFLHLCPITIVYFTLSGW